MEIVNVCSVCVCLGVGVYSWVCNLDKRLTLKRLSKIVMS